MEASQPPGFPVWSPAYVQKHLTLSSRLDLAGNDQKPPAATTERATKRRGDQPAAASKDLLKRRSMKVSGTMRASLSR
jgi:hypothetical protein